MQKSVLAERVRIEVIKRGIKEVKESYDKGSFKLEGALEGFEIAKSLRTEEEFRKLINFRMRRESAMRRGMIRKNQKSYTDLCKETDNKPLRTIKCTEDEYWKHRYATLQIEFVLQRLLVIWGNAPSYSAKAVLQVGNILDSLKND